MKQQVKISKVKGNPDNPRIIKNDKFKKLVKSIQEFPEMLKLRPIVVDEDFMVLGGNMRLKASKDAGLKEVWIEIAEGLTEEQKKEFIVKDNVGFGEWEWDMLANEWDSVQLAEWGLDVWENEDDKIAEAGLIEDDEIPEVKESKVKRGDIWQLGEHRIMCGDSTSSDDVAKLMNGEKADMVFTDPPYGVDYKGIKNDDRSGLEELLTASFSNLMINTKDGGSFYCFHSDRCGDIFHKVYREFAHFSSMIIWKKESIVLSQTDHQSIHEPCLYGWFDNGTHKWYGDRKQQSVWEFKAIRLEGHTTPKPVLLIEKALSNSSKKQMLIIDLFLGSGSTLIAAEKLKRKCYGMELDEKYCDVIIERWEQFTGQKAKKI
jgi:DNA modification methylase